jgi:hypothetical protein
MIRDCYNHKSAHNTWEFWKLLEQITKDFVKGDHKAVREREEEIRKIEEDLWPVYQCVRAHEDYWKLIDHFKFKYEDVRELDWLFDIYWQAHLNDFPIYWEKVHRFIDEARYRHAGRELARIDADVFRNASRRHVHAEELKAFYNGMFYKLELESPY